MKLKTLAQALLLACTLGGASVQAADIDFTQLTHRVTTAEAPVVYFTSDISPEGLMAAYEALGREPTGKVAIKLSTGEAGNSNHLQPALIKDLVHKLDGTIVECNTAYGGSRSSTLAHRQVIKDHGFDAIATVDIMDEDGSMEIPVTGGEHLKVDRVGSHLANYDSMVVLTHFKGHAMGGFGGALKNISIGVASQEGKNLIHTAGHTDKFQWGAYGPIDTPEHVEFIEAMAEAADAVSDYFDHGQKMLYISVMNNMSVDCDCDGNPAAVDMHDIGILASLDPVALDQACVDLVYQAPDGAALIERMESRQGPHILDHAVKMGLGSKNYQLVSLDQE